MNINSGKNSLDDKTKQKFLKYFWGIVAIGVGVVALTFLLISVGIVGYVPPLEELENPKTSSQPRYTLPTVR